MNLSSSFSSIRRSRIFIVFLLVCLSFAFLIPPGEVAGDATVRITNDCRQTVWPGILTGSGVAPSEGGFMLRSGQSFDLELPSDWSGRMWGRTGCNFSSSGVGMCETADCARKLDCTGVGATPPASLVEFTLKGQRSARDFYDVSLVDGFNLPVSVAPSGANVPKANRTVCAVASCPSDLNRDCPTELQVEAAGDVVSCKSACLALASDMYCCSGAYANPNTCQPSSYSRNFKSACPAAYTYAYDDATSLFTCSSSAYVITFCPSSSLSSASQSDFYKAFKFLQFSLLLIVILLHSM